MAARRVASTAVNWTEFASKIPATQKPSFQAFKQKFDGYLRTVNSLPESSPKIDFATYKSKIAVAGMVDDFQKKYEALQVPYPKDTYTASIDQQVSTKKAEYEKFVAASKQSIVNIQAEKLKWETMLPVEEMTMEEALTMVPELNLAVNVHKPRFWPHDQDYEEWRAEAKKIQAEMGDDH